MSGMKYLQVVKRTGMTGKNRFSRGNGVHRAEADRSSAPTVDKMEEMIGSFGPQKEPYTKIVSSSVVENWCES